MNIQFMSKLLAKLGRGSLLRKSNPQLADKLWKSLTTGKPVSLNIDEQNAFRPIVRAVTGRKSEVQTSLGHGLGVRRGAYYHNPPSDNPLLRKGDFSRSVFSEHKQMPIVDVDFLDPLSHKPAQVIHHTYKEFQPALLDFIKSPAGKNSALKVLRTPAGMRIMDVSKFNRGIKPLAYSKKMKDLGVDPFFDTMAKWQGTYNARLMPKPGRKHNIWGLPGNNTVDGPLKDWYLKNPGDFVAKQVNESVKPIKNFNVMMGKNAEIDPMSWRESLIHDRIIKQVVNRQNAKGIIQVDNLLDLVKF